MEVMGLVFFFTVLRHSGFLTFKVFLLKCELINNIANSINDKFILIMVYHFFSDQRSIQTCLGCNLVIL